MFYQQGGVTTKVKCDSKTSAMVRKYMYSFFLYFFFIVILDIILRGKKCTLNVIVCRPINAFAGQWSSIRNLGNN